MIIAVNIRESMLLHNNVMVATQRAWALNLKNCQNPDHEYVIGVNAGNIQGYFRKENAHTDTIDPTRVAFKLSACNTNDIRIINTYINGRNLSGIGRGRYL